MFLYLHNPYILVLLVRHHNIGWRHTNFRYVLQKRYNNVYFADTTTPYHNIVSFLFPHILSVRSAVYCWDNWFDPIRLPWCNARTNFSLFLLLLLRFAFFPCWRCLLAFATADIAAHRRRSAVHRAVVICMHHPVRPDRRHHQQTMCSICFSSITGISGKSLLRMYPFIHYTIYIYKY